MYLDVTYRDGRAQAAYLYLDREPNDVSARTVKLETGLIIDFAADGRPIGIEILAPQALTLKALNEALEFAHHELAREEDLAPLLARR